MSQFQTIPQRFCVVSINIFLEKYVCPSPLLNRQEFVKVMTMRARLKKCPFLNIEWP